MSKASKKIRLLTTLFTIWATVYLVSKISYPFDTEGATLDGWFILGLLMFGILFYWFLVIQSFRKGCHPFEKKVFEREL